MSEILQTVYASAPVDAFPIHTLELLNDDFNVEGFTPGTIRIVQGYDDLQLGLETGNTEAFTAFPFAVSLPPKSVTGRQDLNFQVDNVTGLILKAIESANEAGTKTTVIYRVFTATDLTYPSNPAIEMTAASASAQGNSVTISATFHELVNKAWPRRRYTPSFAPGLKYYG